MATRSRTKGIPYAAAFRSAVSHGTPSWTAVQNIARRWKTTPGTVFQSLHQGGFVQRQQIAGGWIYWPDNGKQTSSKTTRSVQVNLWQQYVDWAIASGHFTPEQLQQFKGSQKQFISATQQIFEQQSGKRTGRTPSRRSRSKTGTSRRTASSSKQSSSSRTTRTSTRRPARQTSRGRTIRIGSRSRRLRRAA